MSKFGLILLYICSSLPLFKCQRFGFNNFYTCHCNFDINCNQDTGQCTGSKCQRGWSGPSCQKQNVALNKPASQIYTSDNRTASLAVDGNRAYVVNDNTGQLCTYTNYQLNPWWKVDLQQTYPIRDINIVYRQRYLRFLVGFKIDVETETGQNITCFQHTGNVSSLSYNYTVTCNNTINGRYVTITVPRRDYIFLCEVEVDVCSVGTFGVDCNNFCHCANNSRCDYVTGSCPEAAGSRCQAGWTGDSCNQECTTGNYGLNCTSDCNSRKCQGNQDCNHETGKCIDGCRPGYTGDDCTQICVDSNYGLNCSSKCIDRHCIGNQGCYHVTGLCVDGCVSQYGGNDCTQDCNNGYGKYCEFKCADRKCSGNQDCDRTTGKCIEGCLSGYSGDDCTQECPSGYYGLDCRQNCNNRHCQNNNTDCNHVTGRCLEICSPGYRGTDCTQSCHGSYGENCEFQCKDRHCNGSEECDHLTGICLDGCDAGYSGIDCIYSMKFGFKKFYTCHCKDGEFCNSINGLCPNGFCDSGWYGPSCQRQNVALNKDASQIQTISNRPASLAVDGDRDRFTADRCIDTGSIDNPWLRVDLQQTYPIRDINIIYRDTFLHRLIGFIIQVETENGQNTTCYQHTGDVTLSYDYNVRCSSTINGRYVILSVPRNVFILLCEIEVYVCSVETYGVGCNDFCHCAGNVKCDYLTGRCPGNSCQAGWTGSSCNQECADGYYGNSCNLLCSQRFCLNNQASCNNVDGSCGGDCQTGYEGKDCTVTKLPTDGTTVGTTDDTTRANTEDDTGDNTVLIASIVSVVAIVAVIIIIIVVVIIRKRRLLQKEKREDNQPDQASRGDAKIYQNVAFQEHLAEDSNVRPEESGEHQYDRLDQNVYNEVF